MRSIRIGLALFGAVVALNVVSRSAAAQQDSVQIRRATTRDSFRIVIPSPNENLLVLEHVIVLRKIAEALGEFEMEIRGPNRVTITKTAPSTLQGLQEKVRDVVTSLNFICSSDAVARPAWLGVEIAADTTARSSLYPRVVAVERRSPAAIAGIMAGDQIIAVDEVDVRGRPMQEFIKQPGKRITLTLDHNGASRKVQAVLDSGRAGVPVTCEFARSSDYVRILFDRDSAVSRLLKVHPMNPKDTLLYQGGKFAARMSGGGRITTGVMAGGGGSASIFETRNELFSTLGAVFTQSQSRTTGPTAVKSGVRVLVVSPNLQADRGGLKEGDVVTRVGKKQITGVEELRAGIEAMVKQSSIELEVMRDQKATILRIPMRQ